MSDFDSLTAAFSHMALSANGIIVSWATDLFLGLALIEVAWMGIQIMELHSMSIGEGVIGLIGEAVVYGMVRNAFSYGREVIKGFEYLGQQISGQPSLNPQAIYDLGRQLSETIYSMPTMAGPIDEVKVLLAQTIAAWIIDMAFLVVGALATLAYIGTLFLLAVLPIIFALGALSWTADGMWNGISALIRMGMLLLGFYLVIAAGLTFAHSIVDRANAECAPVATSVPWVMSYYVPPTSIVINACSNSLPASSLLIYVADALLLAIVSIWVPFYLSNVVAGSAHTAVNQLMGGVRGAIAVGRSLIA